MELRKNGKYRESINDYIQVLSEYGKMAGEPYIKHLDGDIWELRPILFSKLLLSERLYPLLRETDEAASHRLATIADNNQAEEIINALVYE